MTEYGTNLIRINNSFKKHYDFFKSFFPHFRLNHATSMAESKPLTILTRASTESTTLEDAVSATSAEPGRETETPRLVSEPTKKFPMLFILI